MKGIWTGILVMIAGIVWDMLSYQPGDEAEHGGGIGLPSWVVLLGLLIALTAAVRLRNAVKGWAGGTIAVLALIAVVGWVWDNVAYHWLNMDHSLQNIAHLLYNGGTLALILVALIASVASLFRKNQKTGFPVN